MKRSYSRTTSLVYFSVVLLFFSCGTTNAPYYADSAEGWNLKTVTSKKEKIHSLYLLGDAGELDDHQGRKNYVIDAVADELKRKEVESSVVYLGDNIYPAGLPSKEDVDRDYAENVLNAELELAHFDDASTYFIPGNHDWNEYASGGRKSILRLQDYIEQYEERLDRGKIKLYPKNACGDPKVVKISKDLVFMFIDTQWWLHDWSKESNMNKNCEIKSRRDLLQSMEELFLHHKNDEIVVMMHHPIFSNGKHGGNFSAKDHLFPLTELNLKLWIPLPVLGSIYPLFRKVSGSKQDIANPQNRDVMQGILEVAQKTRANIVFCSGHEHGLQFFDQGKIKHIISGSAGKSDFVRRGGDAEFARDSRGYVRIDFYEDFEAWASFYTVDGFEGGSSEEYRVRIREPRPGTIEESVEYPEIDQEFITIAANEEFAAGKVKEVLFGEEYRDLWATPVKADIIDLDNKHGGLTPVKKGGGQASNSLRLETDNGRQYVLRSIKKDYTKLVPPEFKNLKLFDVIKDQNSASHPYSALIIPSLSRAVNVYYTDPELVYLQHQKRLGNYNTLFAQELYLLEERPNGDWSDNANFGNAKDIIGYVELLELLRDKKRHVVDQEWVLKSRIFDLFIHDWDRHDDQWRWAKFQEGDLNIYRPIPRDRDQAFYKFDGFIPWYISTFILRQFKPIKGNVKDVKHLAFNARHFDRYFLNELEWSDWEEVIRELQVNLTNDVIEQSIQGLPDEVESFNDELVVFLKSRRENLMDIGRRLYDYINKEIEVHGSDRKDHFILITKEDGSIDLTVHVHYDDEEIIKYHRVIDPVTTRELRLYGLRGKDQFEISGSSNDRIKVRIIGGENNDKVINNTASKKIFLYDQLNGASYTGEINNRMSDGLGNNEYNRESFTYNKLLPSFTFGSTLDDGFWVGGNINWTSHGWRKIPYKARQSLSLSVAVTSGNGIQLNYSGHFPRLFGKLDFYPRADLSIPHFDNFFGLGNDTDNPLVNREFHRVRQRNLVINPKVGLSTANNATSVQFGPIYQNRTVENTIGRISDDEVLGFDDNVFDTRNYFGVTGDVSLSVIDDPRLPSNGIDVTLGASHLHEPLQVESVTMLDLSGRFYLRLLNKPFLVLANQIGYERSVGDLQFYHYASIGNNKGLRGFRNERFRGNDSFYHNIDLRLGLFYWANNILPMDVGILGGYDYGKVSLDGVSSEIIHNSQTIGLWFDLLGSFIVQAYYSLNDEQNMFNIQAGFSF